MDEAEREAVRGERLRRAPQPTVGHARLCSRASESHDRGYSPPPGIFTAREE
jgi:hypothetical protein